MGDEPLGRLRRVASDFTDTYRQTLGLAVVTIVGSVADGTADEWSDLDLHVCWAAAEVTFLDPGKLGDSVEPVLRRGGGDHTMEVWQVGDLRVELTHYTLASLDEMVTAVGQRAEPRTDYQVQMRLLLDSMPLLGDDELTRRLAPAAVYPDALAETVVALNLHFYPWAMFDVLVERDDVFFAKQVVVHTVESAMGVLIGINRIYGSPVEATSYERFIRRMTITPRDLPSRLRDLVVGTPREAAPLRRALIEDVFSLVEVHMPAVDAGEARQLYEIR